jgi:dTDP-4-amino-4,6-dideoxygalactose transaminase
LEALERSGNKAKAVFPVHLAGQSPDLEAICNIAKENGLAMVEDACHALGTTYIRGPDALNAHDRAGSCRHGDMAVFSFHPAKTIAMGEGGAITTNDAELAGRLRELRNHGMTRNVRDFKNNDMAFDENGQANPWYYEMANPGFNYRASEVHCALGLSQLGKLDRFAERRRELVARYDDRLAPLSPLVRPVNKVPGNNPAWHLYIALIDFEAAGICRGDLMRRLLEENIGTQVHFIPVHMQPYYRRRYGEANLPGAMSYYNRCLTLPLFPEMADTDVDRVVAALGETIAK